MGLKKLTSLILAGYSSLYGATALAQSDESLEEPGKLPGGLEDIAILDDSKDTWHNMLDVKDKQEKGYKAEIKLKKGSFTVTSQKAGEEFKKKTLNRSDLRYCLIDRDDSPTGKEPCKPFPESGRIVVPGDYTDGWYSLFVVAPVSGEDKKVVRLDEYFRLPIPTGEMGFTRKPKDVEKKSTEEQGAESSEDPWSRWYPKERGEQPTESGEETKGGEEDDTKGKEKSIAERTERAVETARAETEVNQLGFFDFVNASLRLGAEPFSHQQNTLPNSTPRIGTDGFNVDAALGYVGSVFSVGPFGSFNSRSFEVGELGSRVALGTGNDLKHAMLGVSVRVDNIHGKREDFNLRISPAFILRHSLDYGIGSAVHITEETGKDSIAFGLHLTMPGLILNNYHGSSLGLANELDLESLGSLTQESTARGNSVDYGRREAYINRLIALFGVKKTDLRFALGWQHDSTPTLRLREDLSNSDRDRLNSTGDLYLGDLTKDNFTGNQLLFRLAHYPVSWDGYGYGAHAVMNAGGDELRRNGVGFRFGKRGRFSIGYDYLLDMLKLGESTDASDHRHLFYLEVGTEDERSLLPTRAPFVSSTLR